MTSRAFGRSGFKQRYPDVQVIHPLNPELSSWQRGAVTTEYFNAHQRTVRRLRRILARKREMQKWCKKWDAMHDRYVKEREELQACKPRRAESMIAYLRIVLSVVIVASVYGLFVPILISMKDTTAVISGFALGDSDPAVHLRHL